MTQTNCSSGISTRMFLRLFCRAPRTTIDLPLAGLRFPGTPIVFLPLRYLPVSELSSFRIFFNGPSATTLAAMHARAWADLEDVVRRPNRVGVVLDHDHGIAQIAKSFQRLDHLDVVFGMQPDARFVKHVQHSHEARADL